MKTDGCSGLTHQMLFVQTVRTVKCAGGSGHCQCSLETGNFCCSSWAPSFLSLNGRDKAKLMSPSREKNGKAKSHLLRDLALFIWKEVPLPSRTSSFTTDWSGVSCWAHVV